MRKFPYFSFVLGLVVISCVSQTKNEPNVQEISVDINKQADISEFVSSFDGCVPLETNEDCLVDEIRKL